MYLLSCVIKSMGVLLNKIRLEAYTERSESNPGRNLGIYEDAKKAVWKTVPSEARVTRDEVSGLIDRKEASVWKTVPFSIRKKNQEIKIRLKK